MEAPASNNDWALAALLTRALLRATIPDPITALPTAPQAENIITSPQETFLLGFIFFLMRSHNLEVRVLVSAEKQQERDAASTMVEQLAASSRELANAGIPNTPAAQKAQAALMQSIDGTLMGSREHLARLDDKRNKLLYQLAPIASALEPGDTTNEAIINSNLHALWTNTSKLFRLTGDHELLDRLYDAFMTLHIVPESGAPIPAARVILRNFTDLMGFLPLCFPNGPDRSDNQKNQAFYSIMLNTSGYGPLIAYLGKGRNQSAQPKLSKETRQALTALLDTYRFDNHRDWEAFVLTSDRLRVGGVGAVGSRPGGGTQDGAGTPAAAPPTNAAGVAGDLTPTGWYLAKGFPPSLKVGDTLTVGTKDYAVTGFRYWRHCCRCDVLGHHSACCDVPYGPNTPYTGHKSPFQ